jgi:PAS domain S-box-containing protein
VNAKHKILIMNEAAAPRNFMAGLLEANGYLLRRPTDGDEVPDGISTEAPAVALFDLTVKNMDVLEAMRRLHMRSPGTECIMLADQASHESAIEAVKLGAFFYLQKPYEPEQLLLAIRRAIEKRQAAEAWAENEEKQRVLMDNVRDAIMLCDRDGVLLSVNRAAAELLGSTPDAIVGKTLNDIHPNPVDANLETIRRVMESGTTIKSECERPLRAGAWKFLVTYHPVRDAHGEIVAVQVVEYDITERKQATNMTATAERLKMLFHRIINHSEDGIIVADMNGKVLLASDSTAALLGKKTSELVSRPLPFSVAAGKRFEMGIVRGRGEPGIGEVRAVKTECDGRPVYLVTIRDISGAGKTRKTMTNEKTVSSGKLNN